MLNTKDHAEIVRLEEAMWREATRFDLAFQEATFSADFVEFGRSGRVYTRAEIIRTDSHPIHAKLPLANLHVTALDDNIVLVTYNSEAVYAGVVEHARRSSIWSRSPSPNQSPNQAAWVMRFHQGTPYFPGGEDPAASKQGAA
jgi:hypothetical protein